MTRNTTMNFTQISTGSGVYETQDGRFRIIRADYGFGTEWSLLEIQSNGDYDWIETYKLLREAKSAAAYEVNK